MSKEWKHREWHIRNELFRYKTEFEICYLALYISLAYIFLSRYGVSILTIVISVASFWLLMILIIILTVEVESVARWMIGCKGDDDYPKIYLKD